VLSVGVAEGVAAAGLWFLWSRVVAGIERIRRERLRLRAERAVLEGWRR